MERTGHDGHPEPFVLSKELNALEGVHSIEVLLYILDNEGCKKVDLYALLGRSTSVQSRMDALVSCGLVRIERRPGTRANFLHLTDKGRELATILRDFDDTMRYRPPQNVPMTPVQDA